MDLKNHCFCQPTLPDFFPALKGVRCLHPILPIPWVQFCKPSYSLACDAILAWEDRPGWGSAWGPGEPVGRTWKHKERPSKMNFICLKILLRACSAHTCVNENVCTYVCYWMDDFFFGLIFFFCVGDESIFRGCCIAVLICCVVWGVPNNWLAAPWSSMPMTWVEFPKSEMKVWKCELALSSPKPQQHSCKPILWRCWNCLP